MVLTLCPLLALAWAVQAKPNKAEVRDYKREMIAEKGGKKSARDSASSAKSAPNAAMSRGLEKLRESLEVDDDAEWDVIAARIMRVSEVRSTLWTGAAGSKAAPSLSAKGKKSSGTPGTGHAEQDALRSAVKDNLPDAEVKVRLARAHEVFEKNGAVLAQAQAELRAVLSVRQEAVAVMAGLLPP